MQFLRLFHSFPAPSLRWAELRTGKNRLHKVHFGHRLGPQCKPMNLCSHHSPCHMSDLRPSRTQFQVSWTTRRCTPCLLSGKAWPAASNYMGLSTRLRMKFSLLLRSCALWDCALTRPNPKFLSQMSNCHCLWSEFIHRSSYAELLNSQSNSEVFKHYCHQVWRLRMPQDSLAQTVARLVSQRFVLSLQLSR